SSHAIARRCLPWACAAAPAPTSRAGSSGRRRSASANSAAARSGFSLRSAFHPASASSDGCDWARTATDEIESAIAIAAPTAARRPGMPGDSQAACRPEPSVGEFVLVQFLREKRQLPRDHAHLELVRRATIELIEIAAAQTAQRQEVVRGADLA